MSIRHLRQIWPIVLLGTTSACAHVGDAAEQETAPRKPIIREHDSVEGVGATESKPVRPTRGADPMTTMVADLAQRLKVPVSSIEVVSVDPMTWNDSSLGCPQPGQAYLQALTPGLRVIMRNNAKTYEYHAANSGAYVYCTNPTRTVEGLDTK